MRSVELMPCQALRPYVRLIWILELDDPAEFGPPERITPDGLVEVVFHYRAPVACRFAREAYVSQPRSVVVSQTRRYVEILPTGATGLVSVRFQPWGFHHFFRQPVRDVADQQVAAEELWRDGVAELEEQLYGAAGDDERRILVERFLLGRLERHHKTDVEPLVRAVWSRRGHVRIPTLCNELGIGERRLQRLFSSALGTTPKNFVRLSRFLYACGLLESGQQRLVDVGLTCGYYDQSHFAAEFKEFSGLTPSDFLDRQNVSYLEID